MTDATESSPGQQRDRSPAYPIVPLGTALERLAQFDAHFKRSPARPGAVATAWNITGKAYGDRIAAALRYFGLLRYEGSGKDRQVVVSDEGRKYLRAQQEETKREVIRTAALRPKNIAKYWNQWGADRPADAACLDQLVLKDGFSEQGARDFLKVYDQTIAYAGLTSSDKLDAGAEPIGEQAEQEDETLEDIDPPPPPPPPAGKAKIMAGERVVFTEETTPQQYVKLVASGDVDETLLEALEDFVKRQKKRLNLRPLYDDPTYRDRRDAEIKRRANATEEDAD